MADALARGLRLGFPAYAAFTYFVFYGEDHLSDPITLPERPRPGLAWRASIAVLSRLLGRSAESDPLPSARPRAQRIARKPVAPAASAAEAYAAPAEMAGPRVRLPMARV